MKNQKNIPTYSILRMRDECFICTEALENGNRFRRLSIETDRGFDPYAANEAIAELWKTRGNCSVEVDESDGTVIVKKGSKRFTGSIITL